MTYGCGNRPSGPQSKMIMVVPDIRPCRPSRPRTPACGTRQDDVVRRIQLHSPCNLQPWSPRRISIEVTLRCQAPLPRCLRLGEMAALIPKPQGSHVDVKGKMKRLSSKYDQFIPRMFLVISADWSLPPNPFLMEPAKRMRPEGMI